MKERKRKSYEQLEADRKLQRKEERQQMSRKERKEAARRDKKKLKEKRARNKEFARVTYFFVALFLVMMGYIVYFQVKESRDVIRSPYNARQDSYADRVVRGDITDRNGKVLAHSEVQPDGTEVRQYPYGSDFAHVVGYSSQGKSGLESEMNFELLTSNAFSWKRSGMNFRTRKISGIRW